ncbi:hypothetical protein GOBAR_AA15406 [Gossypium barbadense]|uniref:B box-type domain-containing protein n=1 Tax=Gossypium barbadense TaxID=3634 RepID=A0A2P5XPL6_GOSBA|nr:hypothetical protein GOBAR_AA15406 [Gossypium barbadense]
MYLVGFVRRYVYHDVIRLDDATKLMDCAFVQSYITNSAKVIFINQRPQTRHFRGSGNFCTICGRSLQDPYLFCSLSCKLFSSYVPRWLQVLLTEKFFNACIIHEDARKNEKNIYCLDCCISICPHCLAPHSSHRLLQIDYLSRTEDGLSKFLFECNYLPLPDSGLDDGLVTPDSVLEPSCSTKTSSGSGGYDEVWCRALACTATTLEIVRKKRTSLTACRPTCPPVSEVSGNLMNRRKKAPQRAPLY